MEVLLITFVMIADLVAMILMMFSPEREIEQITQWESQTQSIPIEIPKRTKVLTIFLLCIMKVAILKFRSSSNFQYQSQNRNHQHFVSLLFGGQTKHGEF